MCPLHKLRYEAGVRPFAAALEPQREVLRIRAVLCTHSYAQTVGAGKVPIPLFNANA